MTNKVNPTHLDTNRKHPVCISDSKMAHMKEFLVVLKVKTKKKLKNVRKFTKL